MYRQPLDIAAARHPAIPQNLYARLDDPRVAPADALAALVRAGGVVRAGADSAVPRAWIDPATGGLTLVRAGVAEPAGNLIGLFCAPGAWCGVLPLDERGAVRVALEGAFDLSAAMALERALGGLRTAAERAMTTGAPLSLTVPELVAFLLNLLDDTRAFVARATTPNTRRLRNLLSPHSRLHSLRIVHDDVPLELPDPPLYLLAGHAPGTRVRAIAL